VSAGGFEQVVLAAGGSRVVIVPALGGKISEMTLAGRQWLWTSDTLPYAAPTAEVAADDAASYVRTADTGGYDECFPTVGSCVLPAAAGAYAGLALPDHGELWSQAAITERFDGALADAPIGAAGEVAVTRWRGRRMPYTLTRTVRVDTDGAVHMHYAAANLGDESMPLLWSAHPLLPLTAATRVELPLAARVRVNAEHGIALGGPAAEHRWPIMRVGGNGDGGTNVDLAHPASVGHDYACKLFLDLPPELHVRAAVEEGGVRLEVEFDTREVPHFGLWLNHHGWTPFEGGTPYRNLAFEPCIGAPDRLSDALDGWDSAAWLGPREMRRWSLVWRGMRAGDRGATVSARRSAAT
jgi:galactose mutarotase-like enzyme